MSEAVTRVSLLPFDRISAQGKAIAARLQLAFPPGLFQFKYLPAKPDKASWKALTQGNQPFLGLGFAGVKAADDARVFVGVATWVLLVCVRQNNGTPQSLYYGDAQGDGALKMAVAAAAVLQGFVANSGTVVVCGISNAISEAWDDNSAVLALDLRVPLTIRLDEAIAAPGGLGIFEELFETWNFPNTTGSADIYTSDWENPNVPI